MYTEGVLWLFEGVIFILIAANSLKKYVKTYHKKEYYKIFIADGMINNFKFMKNIKACDKSELKKALILYLVFSYSIVVLSAVTIAIA